MNHACPHCHDTGLTYDCENVISTEVYCSCSIGKARAEVSAKAHRAGLQAAEELSKEEDGKCRFCRNTGRVVTWGPGQLEMHEVFCACESGRRQMREVNSSRVSRGFYRHYKGDVYFVVGVGILDQDGHGNPDAPRQVVYESTRSTESGLLNLRSEEAFLERVEWPDGKVRSRFVRMEHES